MTVRTVRSAVLVTSLWSLLANSAQAQEYDAGPLSPAAEAYDRLTSEEVAEVEAYTLGVQTVLWGMQWVKAGLALRQFGTPLPEGMQRQAVDPIPRGYNIWGKARALLNHEMRILETPNTETPYNVAVVDLQVGPVVVVHPAHGGRYFRTSLWDGHGDTRTISQKKDGDSPPPYRLVPFDRNGFPPAGM